MESFPDQESVKAMTHHYYSSVVACGVSELRAAKGGVWDICNRTIQAQSKPIQSAFTYKPNYFLVLVHSHQTKAQPNETQTNITSCKPDH